MVGGVTKGQRAFFLIIGCGLVAGQSSPHRHEAEGGGVTKGQSSFFLIIFWGGSRQLPLRRAEPRRKRGRTSDLCWLEVG
jgi:hypothetical protein